MFYRYDFIPQKGVPVIYLIYFYFVSTILTFSYQKIIFMADENQNWKVKKTSGISIKR